VASGQRVAVNAGTAGRSDQRFGSSFLRCDQVGEQSEERTPFGGFAGDTYFATLCFDEALGKCQSKPGTGEILGHSPIKLVELLEEPPDVLGCDSNAGVLNREAKEGRTLWGKMRIHATLGGGEFRASAAGRKAAANPGRVQSLFVRPEHELR